VTYNTAMIRRPAVTDVPVVDTRYSHSSYQGRIQGHLEDDDSLLLHEWMSYYTGPGRNVSIPILTS